MEAIHGYPAVLPGRQECASSLKNVMDALYVIGGKWKLPLILSLIQSPKRFNHIQNELQAISPKVLAKELKDLELNEFIRRIEEPGSPKTIVYHATAHSLSLKNVLYELGVWGGRHREVIKKSISRPL